MRPAVPLWVIVMLAVAALALNGCAGEKVDVAPPDVTITPPAVLMQPPEDMQPIYWHIPPPAL